MAFFSNIHINIHTQIYSLDIVPFEFFEYFDIGNMIVFCIFK